MQLHRSKQQADWAILTPAEYNAWQRVASRTHGIVTPGNVLTVVGLLLVFTGLWLVQLREYWPGLAVASIGRLCDIGDGLLAERTGTKSPLGEKLDAGFDKLATLAGFVLLVTAHALPLPAAIVLLLPNLDNALLTIIASRRGFTLHPSQNGKLGMAVTWAALGSFLLAKCLGLRNGSWLWNVGAILTAIGLVYGVRAAADYIRAIRAHPRSVPASDAPASQGN